MSYHVPPRKVAQQDVVKYSALKSHVGHLSVAMTYDPATRTYSLFILSALDDNPWEIESGEYNLTEFGATSMFRSYEQRG